MDKWIVFAFVSMLFAGMTSVIAKMGMAGISAELSLAVRTCFVSVFVLGFAAAVVPRQELSGLGAHNVRWLALSAATTAVSWIFYYKAIKLGDVSTVALIDKGSFLIAVLGAWWLLKEPITPRVMSGSLLIVAGLLVVSRR